mmetsp:Transcript_34684/g.83839  ORF Transcript_34684/g.83839 Transcript_34684/m.83839 type:complete len:102 (+) Transcript_34684:253-558(+)
MATIVQKDTRTTVGSIDDDVRLGSEPRRGKVPPGGGGRAQYKNNEMGGGIQWEKIGWDVIICTDRFVKENNNRSVTIIERDRAGKKNKEDKCERDHNEHNL